MKKIYIVLFAVFSAVTLSSCSAESPFSGMDNRLLSISLTVEGKEYKGTIVNNNVTVSLPVEIDLNNAQVAYALSENASILPDPAKVTAWNDDQVFNVFSHNGTKRTYVVHIKRQLEHTEGSVLLATDADVKAFAEKNIAVVKGDLIIGNEKGTDSISNIDALTYLTQIGYKLIVNPTYKGKDISGLRNLEETGSVIIRENKYLSDITLKNLKKIGQDFIVNSHSVKKIALTELESIGNKLFITSNKLTEFDLPILKEGGDIKVSSRTISAIKLRELQQINNSVDLSEVASLTNLDLSQLKEIPGDLIIKAPELVGLKLNNLTQVMGNLQLENSKITAALFPELTETGNLSIVNNKNLTNLSLKKLKSVKEYMKLSSSPIASVEDIHIESIGEKLELYNIPSLKDISPLFKKMTKLPVLWMTFVLSEGSLDISKTGVKQVRLEQCNNLEQVIVPEVLDELYFSGDKNAPLKKPIRISGLKQVKQSFEINKLILSEPQDWALPELEKTGAMFIREPINLKSFSAPDLKEAADIRLSADRDDTVWEGVFFEKLTKTNTFYCESMTFLKNIKCPKLREVNTLLIGNWSHKNETLTNLNALSSIEKIEALTLRNNENFIDYSFLKTAITNGSITREIWDRNFSIASNGYNPTFEDLQAGHYVKQ